MEVGGSSCSLTMPGDIAAQTSLHLAFNRENKFVTGLGIYPRRILLVICTIALPCYLNLFIMTPFDQFFQNAEAFLSGLLVAA